MYVYLKFIPIVPLVVETGDACCILSFSKSLRGVKTRILLVSECEFADRELFVSGFNIRTPPVEGIFLIGP